MVSSEIRKLVKYDIFGTTIDDIERSACKFFKNIVIVLHFLNSYLNLFLENLGGPSVRTRGTIPPGHESGRRAIGAGGIQHDNKLLLDAA